MTPSHRLASTTVLALTLGLAAGSVVIRSNDRAMGQAVPQKGEKPEASEKKDEPKKKAQGLPLKSDRTIEFTTDEGTWVSLDVSPDGKTIVFELLGDLYTVPIDGGEAKAITTGLAFDSQPSYSPDGKIDRVRQRPRRCREPVGRRRRTARMPGR